MDGNSMGLHFILFLGACCIHCPSSANHWFVKCNCFKTMPVSSQIQAKMQTTAHHCSPLNKSLDI
eukprot:scaffold87362_cov19-Tisochrysis_lutea.AAC.1